MDITYLTTQPSIMANLDEQIDKIFKKMQADIALTDQERQVWEWHKREAWMGFVDEFNQQFPQTPLSYDM